MTRRIPLSVVLLLLLISTAFAAGENEHLFVLPVQRLTVVRTPKAPMIDGKLKPGEWRYAAAISGEAIDATSIDIPARNFRLIVSE